MFVVRPLNVLVSTRGLGFSWREKLLLSWLSPRGIVAAAIASIVAQKVSALGLAGGEKFQALVFMVIAMTVVLQGLSGGYVAQLLGLRRAEHRGYAILGANELGHTLGRLLRDSGEEVVFLDNNPATCSVVEQDGFRVIFGNVLEERTLLRAQLDDRAATLAVTPNDEANLLFGQRAAREFKVGRNYIAIARGGGGAVNLDIVRKAGGRVLFGKPRDLELWALRLRRDQAPIEMWQWSKAIEPPTDDEAADALDTPEGMLLPLVIWRGDRVFPVNKRDGVREDDVAHIAVVESRRDEAHAWLRRHGWSPIHDETGPGDPGPPATSVEDQAPTHDR